MGLRWSCVGRSIRYLFTMDFDKLFKVQLRLISWLNGEISALSKYKCFLCRLPRWGPKVIKGKHRQNFVKIRKLKPENFMAMDKSILLHSYHYGHILTWYMVKYKSYWYKHGPLDQTGCLLSATKLATQRCQRDKESVLFLHWASEKHVNPAPNPVRALSAINAEGKGVLHWCCEMYKGKIYAQS